jgi:hypothetical protein
MNPASNGFANQTYSFLLVYLVAVEKASRCTGICTATTVDEVLDEAMLLLQEHGTWRFWQLKDIHAWDRDAFRQKLHAHIPDVLESPANYTKGHSKHAAESFRQRMVTLMQTVQVKLELWQGEVSVEKVRAGRPGPSQPEHSSTGREINEDLINTILENPTAGQSTLVPQSVQLWCQGCAGSN